MQASITLALGSPQGALHLPSPQTRRVQLEGWGQELLILPSWDPQQPHSLALHAMPSFLLCHGLVHSPPTAGLLQGGNSVPGPWDNSHQKAMAASWPFTS